MAWNEPGGSKDKDPWGNRGNKQGPPDLDEIIKKLQKKFAGIFGGKKGGGSGSGTGDGGVSMRGGAGGIAAIVAILVAAWLVYDSIHVIQQAERGVVLRFGKYVATIEPGLNFRMPRPIETVEKINVSQIRRLPVQAQMLTKDQNLIRIDLAVQFKVKNELEYLLKVRNPDFSLRESTESALREVVGGKNMDDILSLSGGRDVLVNDIKLQIQETIDKYETGLSVVKVNLQNAQPPAEVQEAFQDAIKAEEDEVTVKNQAEAYARDVYPRAEGDAQRLVQEAEAYKQQVINKSEGETSRFLQTLKEYRKAPQVTRKRLYLEAIEDLLANSSKVMVNLDKGANNVLYLPIDRLMRGDGRGTSTQGSSGEAYEQNPTATQEGARDRTRERRIR